MSRFKNTQQEIAPSDTRYPQPVAKKRGVAAFFKLDATRKITYMAALIAVAVVAKLFSVDLTPSHKISFLYLPCYLAGALFGPAFGFMTGVGADLVGVVVRGGAPIPLVTIGNGLMGFIVGVIFHLKLKASAKLIIGIAISLVVCTLGINTLGLAMRYANPDSTIFQNYFNWLFLYGLPMPRIIFQPLVVLVNAGIAIPMYSVTRKYILKTLGNARTQPHDIG